MNQNMEKLQRRTVGYWFEDGLVDLFVGAVFLLLGLFFAISRIFQHGFLSALSVGVGQPIIILATYLLGRQIIPVLKEKYIYPRTGYVSYRQPTPVSRTRRIVAALIVSFCVSAAVMMVLRTLDKNMTWLITGICMAVFMAFLAYRSGLVRYLLLGGIAIFLGAFATAYNLDSALQPAVFYGLFGIAWTIFGGVSLARYLRNHNLPEQGNE
jgi:hypothetical protein